MKAVNYLRKDLSNLIEQYNDRASSLTKLWAWIAVLSMFGLLTITQEGKQPDSVTIPVIDLTVPMDYFAIVFLAVLASLIIKWSEASMRLLKFRKMEVEKVIGGDDETRRYFDGLVASGTMTIWGLLPPFSSYPQKGDCYSRTRAILYLILKTVAYIVHYFLPLLVIFLIIYTSNLFHIGQWQFRALPILGIIFSVLALYSLFVSAYGEITYSKKIKSEN